MEKVAVPMLTVSFAVDLDVEYNSFGGKTADEIAEALFRKISTIFSLKSVPASKVSILL